MALARSISRWVLSPVADVLLPRVCWAGGDGEATFGLSDEKREEIMQMAARPYCRLCGLGIGYGQAQDPCVRCGSRQAGVGRIARVGPYREPLITLVHQMKFSRRYEVARVLGPLIYRSMLEMSEHAGPAVDVIVPVPLHWRREAARGFNQAEELACEVSRLSGWPVAGVLRRVRATREQAQLESPAQRAENLRGAFVTRRGAGAAVAGKHVWLLDDVTTTGATLAAAVRALQKMPREERPRTVSAGVVCVTDTRE